MDQKKDENGHNKSFTTKNYDAVINGLSMR